jgi:hypothetical protein
VEFSVYSFPCPLIFFRYSYSIFILKVATQEIESLAFLKKIVPDFPEHAFEEVMSRKSEVYPQAVCFIY